MGRPLTKSIDSYFTYPLVYQFVGYFQDIHPIYITLVCISTKVISLELLSLKYRYFLAITLLAERFLDCLDGEVARYYQKCTKIGHYLDKYSDLVYRVLMTSDCLTICYQAEIYNVSWYLLLLLSLVCPGVYVYEYLKGKLGTDLIVTKNSYAIIIEDNATLFCLLLPVLISFIS